MPDPSAKFAGALWAAIKQQGLTYRQTALRAREHLPPGSKLSDVSVWSYAQGRSLPRRRENVDALEKALGVDPGVLLALHGDVSKASRTMPENAGQKPHRPGLQVADLGDGSALLRVSQVVTWSVALRMLERLHHKGPAPKVKRQGLIAERSWPARS